MRALRAVGALLLMMLAACDSAGGQRSPGGCFGSSYIDNTGECVSRPTAGN
jgi:hypothetical protein